MGVKDWMLFYASDDVSKVLRAAPKIDREATAAFVERLYPSHDIRPIEDGNLHYGNPPEGTVYAGVFPGLSIICTWEAAGDSYTDLPDHFVSEAAGRTLYLHAMHSVVDFFSYAIWEPDGTLRRAYSLSPDSGVIADVGTPCRSRRSTGRATRSSSKASTPTTSTRSASTRSTWPRPPCASCSASTTRARTRTMTRSWRRSCWRATPSRRADCRERD